MRKAALLYGLARVGLFLLAAVLVWSVSGLLGHQLNGLPLALVAALMSSMVGYVVFAPQRRQLAEALEEARATKAAQIAERRARLEDES
jgi:cell division protein FtsL